MNEQYLRTGALIGEEGIELLKQKTVAVFGLGGVGSYAVEALARSGIGRLYLYDNDTVSQSNRNRQLIALESTVGKLKTRICAERIKDIDSSVEVVEMPLFVTSETEIPFGEFDFLIDAIDNVSAKLYLIENAQRNNVPAISVMGTGNKFNPQLLQVTDIFSTYECPLAKVMRVQLKKRGIRKQKVVWSPEHPAVPAQTAEKRTTGRATPGSMAFVPASAGILAAAYTVNTLLGKKI